MLAVAVAVSLLVASPIAPPESPAPVRPQPAAPKRSMLAAGQPAPALQVEAWIKGEPVATFEPGKVYVIEFWATWCGPCIAGISHLTELQHRYAEQGLVVIGVTSRDNRNLRPAVESMVAMRGAGMDYRVAWDGKTTAHRAYMNAAALASIPASFVVGKDGTLEYIGHPQTLDLVVPKLLDGTWDRVRDTADVRAAESARGAMDQIVRTDPKTAMERYVALAERWPSYASQFLNVRQELEQALGQSEAAAKTMDLIEARAIEGKDVIQLRGLALRLLARKDEPGILDRCLRLAKAAGEASSGKDSTSMRVLSKVLQARGDQPGALEAMRKAVEWAEPTLRPRLEAELQALEANAAPSTPAPPATDRPN